MSSRVIDAVLRLTDNFSNNAGKALKTMTSMSKAGVRVGQDIERAGKKITDVGAGLTSAITVPLAGVATAAVKTAADFEASMSNVHAIMGDSYDDSLSEFAKQLGATTAWSAQEVSQAMQYTGMAGWTAKENIEGLKGILDLASASGTDLALTSDILTDAVSAFGYTAADSAMFADTMTAACTSANVSVETLGESYKYCGALCGTMNYELDQVTTALAIMGNNGIKGSQAGTALRSAISNLAAPTKQMRQGMDALGISITNQDGTMKTFEEVIESVRNGFQGLSEDQQAAYAKQIFGKQAMAGMLAIINTSTEEYNKLAVAVSDSGDAADKAAKTQLNNLNGQLTLLKSALEGASITIGNKLMPYLKNLTEHIQKVVDKFNGLSEQQIDQILKWAAIAAAVGPAIMIFGKVVTMVGTAIKVFNAVGLAIAKAGGIMGAIASPVMLVIGVIAVLVAVVLLVKKHFDVFKSSMSALSPVFEDIKGHITSMMEHMQTLWTTIQPIVSLIANAFGGVLVAAIGGAIGFLSGLLNGILAIVDGVIMVLTGLVEFLAGVFTGDWERAWSGISGIFEGIWEGILGIATGIFNGIIQGINGFLGGLNGIKFPDWVPVFGGKGFNIPLIPTLAKGTDSWKGGIVQVSERGGEIIDLPRGSRVYPHDESVQMARREGAASSTCDSKVTITGNTFIVREEADIDKIGDAIARKLRKAKENRGGWTFSGNMA